MKTTGLSIYELENRIKSGLCYKFKYLRNDWWSVSEDLLRISRKTTTGMSFSRYKAESIKFGRSNRYEVINE